MNILSPRKASDAAWSGHAVRVLRRSALREVAGDLTAAEALDRLRKHHADQ